MGVVDFDFKDLLKPLGDIGTKLVGLIPDKNKAAEITRDLELAKYNLEQKAIELEQTIQAQVTERAKADMMSDSWLSKNVRPLALIGTSAAYLIMVIVSYFGYDPNEIWVDVIKYLLYMIFGFYFGGRTVEKSVASISAAIKK